MNFEDIVDMEWVDAGSSTLEESNEFSDLYFNQQQQQPEEPQIKEETLSSMPSTEQIKQLIEIAKQQLVLREQLQTLAEQQPNNSLFQFLTNPNGTELQTAAPSTIFAPPSTNDTPFMPALSSSTITSTDMTLAPINETTTKTSKRRDSIASLPEESISLEAYAEADGIDLKKLTPKERRQLRNKISARNFRVRRKEYISTLEGQVNEQKEKVEELKEKLTQAEDENKQLRKEVDTLNKQNQLLLQQQKTPSSPRIPKPNLNKDISILGTKATDSYRQQDNFILVSSAVMPEWDYKAILEKPMEPPLLLLPTTTYYHHINKLAGHFILSVVQLASTILPASNHHYHNTTTTTTTTTTSSAYNMEDLYDSLIHSALSNNSTADKSFLW